VNVGVSETGNADQPMKVDRIGCRGLES